MSRALNQISEDEVLDSGNCSHNQQGCPLITTGPKHLKRAAVGQPASSLERRPTAYKFADANYIRCSEIASMAAVIQQMPSREQNSRGRRNSIVATNDVVLYPQPAAMQHARS